MNNYKVVLLCFLLRTFFCIIFFCYALNPGLALESSSLLSSDPTKFSYGTAVPLSKHSDGNDYPESALPLQQNKENLLPQRLFNWPASVYQSKKVSSDVSSLEKTIRDLTIGPLQQSGIQIIETPANRYDTSENWWKYQFASLFGLEGLYIVGGGKDIYPKNHIYSLSDTHYEFEKTIADLLKNELRNTTLQYTMNSQIYIFSEWSVILNQQTKQYSPSTIFGGFEDYYPEDHSNEYEEPVEKSIFYALYIDKLESATIYDKESDEKPPASPERKPEQKLNIYFLTRYPGDIIALTVVNRDFGASYGYIGNLGVAQFTQRANIDIANDLYIGFDEGSSGEYILEKGNLHVDNLTIGVHGIGKFSHKGGNTIVNSGLYLGTRSTGEGSYYMSKQSKQSSSSLITKFTAVGENNIGNFYQDCGDHLTDSLYVGLNPGSHGYYNLSDGKLLTLNSFIGKNGYGEFTQTGGTHVTGGLYIGSDIGSSGLYTFIGGELFSKYVYIGYNSEGKLLQEGGILGSENTPLYSLEIGSNAIGLMDLQNGTLVSNNTIIGKNGNGTFVTEGKFTNNSDVSLAVTKQSTGVFKIYNGITKILGDLVTGAGTSSFYYDGGILDLSGIISVTNEYIGYDNPVSYTQDGNRTNTATNFYLAYDKSSVVDYTLNEGLLETVNAHIGVYGKGELNQYNGVFSSDTIQLAEQAGSTGVLTVSGGSFNAGNITGGEGTSSFYYDGGKINVAGIISLTNEYIGYKNSVNYTQNQSTNSATNFYLAYTNTSISKYILNEGLLDTTNAYIGYYGVGIFDQTGGTHNSSNSLSIGENTSAKGTYNLENGTLYTQKIIIGNYGEGTFVQHNGSHLSSNSLVIGYQGNAKGTYDLTGGTLSTNSLFIGYTGKGTFNQSGGKHTSKNLFLGMTNNIEEALYNLSGEGEFTVERAYLGYFGKGRFTQTGGTFNISNLTVGYLNKGSFEISQGNLYTTNCSIGSYSGYGSLTISGSTSAPLINISTGSLSFGKNSSFFVNDELSTIYMHNASFLNASTSPSNLIGLNKLDIVFDGGQNFFEVGGKDLLHLNEFCWDFALNSLFIEDDTAVTFKNFYKNQTSWAGKEALYVYYLYIDPDSTISFNNNVNLYYVELLEGSQDPQNISNIKKVLLSTGESDFRPSLSLNTVPEPVAYMLVLWGGFFLRYCIRHNWT